MPPPPRALGAGRGVLQIPGAAQLIPHVPMCLTRQPQTTPPGRGDVTGCDGTDHGQSPGSRDGEGLADQGQCHLPEVPQSLHGQGAHAAAGAAAVLVGAASAGERAQLVSVPGRAASPAGVRNKDSTTQPGSPKGSTKMDMAVSFRPHNDCTSPRDKSQQPLHGEAPWDRPACGRPEGSLTTGQPAHRGTHSGLRPPQCSNDRDNALTSP